jgi:hypothetical protein
MRRHHGVDPGDVRLRLQLEIGGGGRRAGQLAARKDLFTEIPAGDLTSLPAGALVVWGKGTSKSGHISIALGDGRESSDFVGRQMTRHYGGAGARVFLPHGKMRR